MREIAVMLFEAMSHELAEDAYDRAAEGVTIANMRDYFSFDSIFFWVVKVR